MKAKLSLFLVCVVLAGGCKRYERIDEPVTAPAPVVVHGMKAGIPIGMGYFAVAFPRAFDS